MFFTNIARGNYKYLFFSPMDSHSNEISLKLCIFFLKKIFGFFKIIS